LPGERRFYKILLPWREEVGRRGDSQFAADPQDYKNLVRRHGVEKYDSVG